MLLTIDTGAMSASRHGGRTPNGSTADVNWTGELARHSRSRCSGEKNLCSYLSRIRIPRSSIRQCIHYTNLAIQAPMQHTYDNLKPNTKVCFVGNSAHFVGNTAHFHSEDDRLQSQPNHTISLMRFSAGPLSHFTQIHGTVPRLDHERFFQNYLHILSHESGFEYWQGRLFSATSRPAPGSTQQPFQRMPDISSGVKRPGGEVNH